METTVQRNITNRRGAVEMKKFVCCLMVIILVCFLFTACSKNRGSNSGLRTIVDMTGRTVSIPATVDKVFVDWGQGKVQIMAFCALDKLVAVDTDINAENYSWARTFVPDFNNVTIDGAPYKNMEALLAYEPDVVFSITTGTRTPDEYERAGIPVVVLKMLDYDTYLQSMAIIGNVLGEKYESIATKLSNFYTDNIAMVTERLQDVDETDKKLIYYVGGPGDTALISMGRDVFEATWVKIAGGKLATEEYTGASIEISKEKLLEINPDMIIIGSQYRSRADKWIMNDASMQNLDAVKSNNIYFVPQGIFGWSKMGPESSMLMVWGAKLLYPDKFTDIDIVQMAKGFYRDFFGAEVSDEYLAMILAGKIPPDGWY
jgi:iron complex transport system substrate-binding protein